MARPPIDNDDVRGGGRSTLVDCIHTQCVCSLGDHPSNSFAFVAGKQASDLGEEVTLLTMQAYGKGHMPRHIVLQKRSPELMNSSGPV
jgi:hypothetical protein